MQDSYEIHTWLGNDAPNLDEIAVSTSGDIVLGSYGGHRQSGASKNEDAALVAVATNRSWRLAALLDAHDSVESASLVVSTLVSHMDTLARTLSNRTVRLGQLRVDLELCFTAPDFRRACESVQGETAVLVCAQRDSFLFWFSVGDCLAYLLHPELETLGQVAVNRRSFFEWLGKTSSFALPEPCFSSGLRELRSGENIVLMATDGLLEYPHSPYSDDRRLYSAIMADLQHDPVLSSSVRNRLTDVHESGGRDSATIIAWRCENLTRASEASHNQSA